MIDASTSALVALWERLEGCSGEERARVLFAQTMLDRGAAEFAELSIGERDALLMDAYAVAFGPSVEAVASCGACDERLEMTFFLEDLRPETARSDAPTTGFEADGFAVTVRRLRARDLTGLPGDLERAVFAALERCTAATRDGRPIALSDLPPALVERVAALCEGLDPASDVCVRFTCAACESQNVVAFDIASFFFATLARLGRAALHDVHLLSSAYGWSERDILSLSGARRRRYLELATR